MTLIESMSFFMNPKCMNKEQCHICLTNKYIQNENISSCANEECNAFVCQDCLLEWYKERRECPICHTRIENDIENDIETQMIEVSQRSLVECECRCNCSLQKISDKIPDSCKLLMLGFLVGFLLFNMMLLYNTRSFIGLYDETKDFYMNPLFYGFIILFGLLALYFSLCIYYGCCLRCYDETLSSHARII